METKSLKERFLEDNIDYKEIEPSQELAAIGGFQDIDEIEDEVWLLQCPKGFDIETELQSQKFKLPGRTNFSTSETVAVEYAEPQKRAFGYCNRKGRYSLRLLPIKGNILLRGRLKGTEAVTLEQAAAICPPQERMLLPDTIKVRHPLHGHQFDKSIRVDKGIAERLKNADEISAGVLREAITNRKQLRNLNTESKKPKQNLKPSVAAVEDDDELTFVGVFNAKKDKKKRKHSNNAGADQEMEVDGGEKALSKKKRKTHKTNINGEEVAEDLQWIQNL